LVVEAAEVDAQIHLLAQVLVVQVAVVRAVLLMVRVYKEQILRELTILVVEVAVKQEVADTLQQI
jgi:hypothetical protein